MPLTEKQLRARDAKRDLGAELLAAVHDMKAGRGTIIGKFPTSTKKLSVAKTRSLPRVIHRDHNTEKTPTAPQNMLTPSPRELQKALTQSAKQAEALAAAYGVKVPYARATVARTAPTALIEFT